jgi:hypothetical protein
MQGDRAISAATGLAADAANQILVHARRIAADLFGKCRHVRFVMSPTFIAVKPEIVAVFDQRSDRVESL